MTSILGISAFYHDSAAALVIDGELVAAAQEERFTRIKHDASFPTNSIRFCLEHAGVRVEDLDHLVFYEKSFLKFERLLETYLHHAPRGWQSFLKSMPIWLRSKLYISRIIRKQLKELGSGRYQKRIIFPEHHQSHAASAFFASPFESAAILTADGVGEWASATLGVGTGNQIQLTDQISFPDSLGLLYSAFTSFCGFRVNGGEGKLMGLAPYGQPVYAELIFEKLVDVKPDGSFRLDQQYFNFAVGNSMTSNRLESLLGGPARVPESDITDRERNLAASIQLVVETILLRIADHLYQKTGLKNLCFAGGVGLNCVANGRLLRESKFENVWIQPAAGDAGGAVGAALFAWHQLLDNPRIAQPGRTMFLGPVDTQESVESKLETLKATFGSTYEVIHNQEVLFKKVVDCLDSQQVVGWHQGRMEFGPRALGNRSILADPRNPEMQDKVNKQIKLREPFRPFAPIVLAERASDFFELQSPSPHMVFAAQLDEKQKNPSGQSTVAAIPHIDDSARVQTLDKFDNPKLHGLLRLFENRIGCPVLLNTSFNLRGEPIVCSVEDSWICFMSSDIDVLVIENCLLLKHSQPESARAAGKRMMGVRQFGSRAKLLGSKERGVLGVLRGIGNVWLRLLFPIRYIVSNVVLTAVFLICLLPVGLMRRCSKRTSFQPIDKSLESYWESRSSGESERSSSYFKQY